MAYIGKQPGTGVRNRFLYTATAGQTTFTTSDSNLALSYSDALYMDVYLNGVLLDPANDYTATSGTSVVLGSGATAGDVLEIVVYDVFSVFNNTIDGNFEVGGNLTIDTNTLHVDSTNNRVGIGTVSPVGHGGFSSGRIVEVKNSGNADTAADNSAISITSSNRHAGLSLESGANRNGYVQFGDPDDDDVGGITYVHSTNDMQFKTAATERLRILGGGGLTFNGDTAAANALDDYEEGTFTATLTADSVAPSTPPTATFSYTKIGRLVHINGAFSSADVTGASGAIRITGLPFAISNARASGDVMFNYLADVGTVTFNAAVYVTGSDIVFYASNDAGSWGAISINAGTGRDVILSATYQTG